jgi:Peptidase C13 family
MASSAGLRRQNKARDKTKKIPDLSGPSPRKTTSHLVVCDAENENDIWLFGDFLGFTSALREQSPPVNGTFINCFDLENYFNVTGEKDIKFGRREEIGNEDWKSGDELVVYTRFDFDHRTTWWTQLNKEERRTIIPRVLEWIRTRTQEAKPGHIVSIILIGHGNAKGIRLGGGVFQPTDLAAACSSFAPAVQINVVIKACNSGVFAKAFKVSNQRSIYVHTSAQADESSFSERRSISGRQRNSVFGAAFVRTFGLMRDPDEIWTLDKQTSFVKGIVSGPTVPPNRRSTPQVVSDSPNARLMMDIMFRDYVDVTFSEAPVRARRILSPQNEARNLLPRSATNLGDKKSADWEEEFLAASAMIESEMGLINTDYPTDGDHAVTNRWFSKERVSPQQKTKNIVQLVQAIAYRFKVQEQFLVVAEYLIRQELLSIDALYPPMNLFKYTASMTTVLQALECFSSVQECMDREDILGKPFEAPVLWLAAVIVRSCADWTRILDRLITIKMLGELNSDLAEEISRQRLKFTVNPGEAEAEEAESPQLGFWLPHGIKIRDFSVKWGARYLSVKAAYEGLIGDIWPDYSIFEGAVARLLEMENALSTGQR